MPEYQYRARDTQGVAHAGTIQAPTKSLAASQLKDRGWIVLAVEAAASSTRVPELRLLDRMRPRSLSVELSLQQLAMMIRSGMTLLAAIDALVQQTPQRSLANVWQRIGLAIQRGKSFSQALRQQDCFPEFVSRLVEVGERTGNLDAVLVRGTTTMKARRNTRDAVISATIYPALVIVLAIAVTIYMVVYLIPRLETYLQSLGKQMPPMTQGLINASYWFRDHWLAVIVILFFVGLAAIATYCTREGRLWFDRNLLKLPVLGQLVRLSQTSTFARSLSMMLKSGITLTDGLGTVEQILGNRYLRSTVHAAREKVIRGQNLVDALHQRQAFTPMLGQMVAVGSQSGELGSVLDEVAELHEAQFQSLVRRINALLTPALTLLIGGIVGYVYIAFFMALVAAGS